jgi:type VI secretion system protein ImpA
MIDMGKDSELLDGEQNPEQVELSEFSGEERTSASTEAGDNPAGIDLRSDNSPDSIYYKLREARAAARTVERSNTAKKLDDQESNPHWKKIIELAPAALEQSKDLEIAAWYTEALLREQAFAGLAEGFSLIEALVRDYGDTLYPAYEEEDGLLDSTLAPLVGLNGSGSVAGTLISPINCVLITNVSNGNNFATWQYTQSLNLARAPNEDVRKERIKSGVPTMDTLMTAAKVSSVAFYEKLSEELDEAIAAYQSLTETLDKKFNSDSPSSSNIKSALNTCRKAIQTLAKDKLAKLEVDGAASVAEGQSAEQKSSSHNSLASVSLDSSDTAENRKNAIDLLRNLTDFFKRTEPHSPIGYTLDRAVRWSGMELPELMRELVVDTMTQKEIKKIAGIEVEPPRVMPPQGAYGAAPGAYDPYAGAAAGQQAGAYGAAPGGYDPNAGMGMSGGYGAAPGGYGAASGGYDPNAGMGMPGGGMSPNPGGFGGGF